MDGGQDVRYVDVLVDGPSEDSAFAWEGDKTQHVVYVGSDGNVHELWFRKGGMNPQWQYGGALNVKSNAPTATGTPSGVGFARNPPEYLKAGDVVETEIEGVGVLRNAVVRV